MSHFIVITTINSNSKAISEFTKYPNWQTILVADKKTPQLQFAQPNIKVLDINWQSKTNYSYIEKCPYNHYSRKNIGYIYAINNGATMILDTDDDNIPYDNWYNYLDIKDQNCDLVTGPKFSNVYKLFTDKFIWPRGFPLEKIRCEESFIIIKNSNKEIAIIQGLADNDPDVDAIYRLIHNECIKFQKRNPVILNNQVYCPLNSQNTLWFKKAFVYLYLPITVNFRFTDILRGYIAQRGLWEIGMNIAFVSPSVYQERNKHILLIDFEDEIECYIGVSKLVDILDNIVLKGNPSEDIIKIYETLAKSNFVKKEEINALESWLNDIN